MEKKTFSIFDLSQTAKEKAHSFYLKNIYIFDPSEEITILKTFCNHFGVKIKVYTNTYPFDIPKEITTIYDDDMYKGIELAKFLYQKLFHFASCQQPGHVFITALLNPITEFIHEPNKIDTITSILTRSIISGFNHGKNAKKYYESYNAFEYECVINHWRFNENGMPAKENIYN